MLRSGQSWRDKTGGGCGTYLSLLVLVQEVVLEAERGADAARHVGQRLAGAERKLERHLARDLALLQAERAQLVHLAPQLRLQRLLARAQRLVHVA